MDFSLEKLQSVLTFENHDYIDKKRHFQAAVLVPFIEINGENHLLFEKRAMNIRQGGEVSFPGGGVESRDNSFEETAIRETIEELQIKKDQIAIFGSLKKHEIPNKAIVYPYIGKIETDFDQLQPSKDEVDYLFTVPFSYFLETKPENLLPSNFIEEERIKKLKKHRKLYQFDYQDEIIWGLTAEIIVSLTKIIKEMDV